MQMLYGCENVATTLHGAKLNSAPMAAFRAPGFVEGTFGLECLLDELAAKLDLDPLEFRRRNHADTDLIDARPFSSKSLLECYRLAEKHWERRHEVRARSDGTWKHGVGLASQVWYGGGGPPSYAWVRVGSDASATVVTAMQDIGTGSRTAMAQIAAEELGLPLEQVRVELGDSARGPYASLSAGSSTIPSMGPAVRSAAGDAREKILELAAQRWHKEQRTLSLKGGRIVCSDGGAWPLESLLGLLEDAQILGTGARGPNPTGMRVLTFGVQVAEVAVDVETGEVRVERVAAIHDVGRIINPLGARSQVEGGIVQAIGHTLSEQRLLDPETGTVLTQTLDAYKLPTIADVPEIVCEFVDEPDAHLTNLGSKGLGEPPIIPTAAAIANAIRDATGADVRSLPIDREEMLRRARRGETQGDGWNSFGLSRSRRPSQRSGTARSPSAAAPTSCRCCATGSSKRRRSSSSARAVATRASPGTGSAPARRSPRSRPIRRSRQRCAKPAGSPPRRSSARWGRSAATSSRRPAAGTGGSSSRATCTAATAATPGRDSTASTPSSATSGAHRAIPPIRRRHCSRSERASAPIDASSRWTTSTASRATTTGA